MVGRRYLQEEKTWCCNLTAIKSPYVASLNPRTESACVRTAGSGDSGSDGECILDDSESDGEVELESASDEDDERVIGFGRDSNTSDDEEPAEIERMAAEVEEEQGLVDEFGECFVYDDCDDFDDDATPGSGGADTPGSGGTDKAAGGDGTDVVKRTRLSGLQNKNRRYLLNHLLRLRKLKTVIGYAVKQSAFPTSKTRKNQYAAFADVIISICHGAHNGAKDYCDYIKGFIDDKHKQSIADLTQGSFTVTGEQRRKSHT